MAYQILTSEIKNIVSEPKHLGPQIKIVQLFEHPNSRVCFIRINRDIKKNDKNDGIFGSSRSDGRDVDFFIKFNPQKKKYALSGEVNVEEVYIVSLPKGDYYLFYDNFDDGTCTCIDILNLEKRKSAIQKLIITGFPKSGTTWVSNIINSSEECFIFNELGACYNFSNHIKYYSNYKESIFNENDAIIAGISNEIDILSRVADSYVYKIVGDKQPYLKVNTLKCMLRNYKPLKIINCLRDPLDVFISIIYHTYYSHKESLKQGKVFPSSDYLQNALSEFRIDSDKQIPSVINKLNPEVFIKFFLDYLETNEPFSDDNKLDVHYENLVTNPLIEVERIFKFLDIILDSNAVACVLNNSSFSLMRTIDANFYRQGLANASEQLLERHTYNKYRKIISELKLFIN
jgi:hypothetical protein